MKHILIAAGFIFFVAWLRSFILTGLSNNTIYLFLFTAACFVYGAFCERLIKIRWLNGILIAGAACVLALSIYLAVYGLSDDATFEEDAVIILGCGLNGEKASRTLQLRLDKAVEYHRRNPGALIFVSGGQGVNEVVPEALVMERYLLDRGVDASKIIREEESLSTYENLNYSVPLMKKHLGERFTAALITSDFHIFRSVWFAGAAGESFTHLHSNSEWYMIPINYARECAAVLKMWAIKK